MAQPPVIPVRRARRARHLSSVAAAVLAGLLTGGLAPAGAAEPAGATATSGALPMQAPALDLRGAWWAALANDPTLRAAQAGALAGREGVAVAESQWRPQASLSISRQHIDQHTHGTSSTNGGTAGRYYWSGSQQLNVRQALYQPVQDAAIAQAGAAAREAASNVDQARQQLALRLAEAYFGYLLSGDQLALVAAQREAHSRQLDAARKAFAAGNGTRTDIDEAQARLDLDAAEALLAEQQREHARLTLEQLVGAPVERAAVLDPARFDATPPDVGALDDWVRQALRRSPEVQALQSRRDAADAEVAKARARHLPTLDLVAAHTRTDPESAYLQDQTTRTASIGLQLNVPLFSGGGVEAGIRQSLADLQRQEAQLAAMRLDVQLRVQQAHRSVQEGCVRVKALAQAVHSGEQLLRSVSRSYEAGVRTTVDVLNAAQQLAEARRNLAQTRFTTLLAELRLKSLGGLIGDAEMEQLNAYLVANASAPATSAAAVAPSEAPAVGPSAAVMNPPAAGDWLSTL